jgi:uncharacterized membrane protein
VTTPREQVDLRASFVLCACVLGGAVLVIAGLVVATPLAVVGTLMIAFGPLGVAVRNALAPPKRPGRRS